MKKILLAGIAVAAICGAPARAADRPVPYKAAPAPVQIFNWTGFYAGIEGGGGWARESFTDNTGALQPVRQKPSGGIFGGELGYRWQTGQWVFGVEGTGAGADLTDTLNSAAGAERFKVRSLYTATGQIGWAMDRWLAYFKGGWAGASTKYHAENGPGIFTDHSHDSDGWTIGGGLEYAMWQNWILGVEYDHFDLKYPGFSSPASNGGAPFVVTNTSRLRVDQVLARLSYKFGGDPWGKSPVSAKY